jgi:outer membrane protein OmpA-like peptidoglycan-associated protein
MVGRGLLLLVLLVGSQASAQIPGRPRTTEPDRDSDGIPDSRDACPDEPETFNGYQDSDGCPDHGVLPINRRGRLEIYDKIYFEAGSRVPTPRWMPLIDAIAAAIKANPELAVVGVVGYASDEERNSMRLATARAQAVRDALVKRGVPPGRLRMHGYGTASPTCTTDSEECRSRNRRVEFPTFERGPPPPPPWENKSPDDRTLARPTSDRR